MDKNYDFSGWATKNNLKCADGRTILPDAFKDDNGKKVPLVWNHCHNAVNNVLGHAVLENRADGVYAYGYFNETEQGKAAKILVKNGDIGALSIYANKLSHTPSRGVTHGEIKEVSLVLAPANPGALIETVLEHGEESSDEELFATPCEELVYGDSLTHAEEKESETKEEPKVAEKEKTVQDVVDSMNEEQKKVLEFLVGEAAVLAKEGKLDKEAAHSEIEEENQNDNSEGGESMKHNLFEAEGAQEKNDVLTHDEMRSIISKAKQYGSLKEAVLQHGITDVEYLFPDAKSVTNPPVWVRRDDSWVKYVMNGVSHSPFSRIRSMYADITEDDARAKGYIKGNFKKEEVFPVLKRTTTPVTVYKKQKMDRDDVVDITDFDVIAWIKGEMRYMLDEELARAFLFGDGRDASSDDKINEGNIRPVWTDSDVYTVKYTITVAANATADQKAKAFINGCVRSRKQYKGSGNPTMFMSEDMLDDCLLLEDSIGHRLYDTVEKLKTAIRAKEIVTVPVMESLSRVVDGDTHYLAGMYLNLNDYRVGADKGGSIQMFEDFDIDYNAQKYLIETRCSGALVVPFSAVALELVFNNSLTVEPEDAETDLLGKYASDLQEGILVNDKSIQGTLKYVTGYTGFSGVAAEQEGNYLALKFATSEGATTVVEVINGTAGPVTLDSDMNCVFRIADKDTQKIKVTSTATDGTVITKTFSLKSLVCEEE